MTRKQLVSGLRALHETDRITYIRTLKKSGTVEISYIRNLQGMKDGLSPQVLGQLIIANPES